jgi:hypothetical protein
VIRPDQVATVVAGLAVLIGDTVVTYSLAWSPIASYATTLNHIMQQQWSMKKPLLTIHQSIHIDIIIGGHSFATIRP